MVESIATAPCGPEDKPMVDMQELFSPPAWKTNRPEIHTVLSDAQINTLTRDKAIFRQYDAGKVLFYEGGKGRDFYILLSGACEVLRSGKCLTRLEQPGSCFGEIAALLGLARTATIRTVKRSECLRIPPDYLQDFLLDHPRVQFRLLEIALKRLSDLDERHAKAEERAAQVRLELLRLARQAEGLTTGDLVDRLMLLARDLGSDSF
jgi:CRP-like cAMP-binding protein